jgi:hypothetical protein
MSTTFGTILDDMKTSTKLAWKSMLSYFLANLGMLIVMALLVGVVAIPVLLVAWAFLVPFDAATMTALAN